MSLILGAALAGGAEGSGKAAGTGLQLMQEQEQRLDLVKMQAQLEEQKALRIAEAEHGFRMEEQGSQQTFLHGEGEANRANALSLGKLQSDTEIKAAGIHAGAALGAANIGAQASMANARLMAAAKSIQTLGDGRIVAIGLDPQSGKQTVNPLMDPNDPSKPLMGMKNLDQRTILLAQGLMQSSVHKMQMGDQAGAAADQQAAQTVLTTGQMSPTGGKAPSMQSVQHLLDHPETATQFDQQFGVGQAAKTLAQVGKTPGASGSSQTVTNPFAPSTPAGAASTPAAPAAPTAPPGSTLTNAPPPGQMGSGMALGNDPTALIMGNMTPY